MLSLLLGGTVYLVVRGPDHATLPADRPSGGPGGREQDEADRRADAAAGLLERLAERLEHGTREQVVALAAPGQRAAAQELTTIRSNIRALGVTNLSLRYVDEDGGRVDPTQQRALGGRAWVGNVQMRWRLRGFDRADSRMETTLTLVRSGSRAAFVSARGNYGNATGTAAITICDPRGPSGSKTVGLTNTCTGASGAREPSAVVVTAAIPS